MVPARHHDPIFLQLIQRDISHSVIGNPHVFLYFDRSPNTFFSDHAVQFTRATVDDAFSRSMPSTFTKHTAIDGCTRQRSADDAFHAMVVQVVTSADVQMATLIVALLYIDRARPHLHIALEQWACERVFLGALMVASKYCNDSTLKNVHWAWATGIFGKVDMALIEREFLEVLNWDLAVRETELRPFQGLLIGLPIAQSQEPLDGSVILQRT